MVTLQQINNIKNGVYNPDMSKSQSLTLRRLQDEKYTLIQTDYDLADLLDNVGLKAEYREDITGAIVWAHDGEYVEVWFTESAAWFDLSAMYHNLAYYQE